MVCTEDYLLTKIEMETGIETPLFNYTNINLPNYPCGVFINDDYVYISMSHIITPKKMEKIYKNEINNNSLESDFLINESNYLINEINYSCNNDSNNSEFEYIFYDDINHQYLEHSIIRLKIKYNDTIGPIVDEEIHYSKYTLDFRTENFYKLPNSSIFSCEIINYQNSIVICGYIGITNRGVYYFQGVVISDFNNKDDDTKIQDLETVSSSIKLQKLNNNILAIFSLYVFELSISNDYGRYKLEKHQNPYFTKFESSEDLYFFNNGFLFTSTGTSNCMFIRKNNSYNHFKLKEPERNITKVLGFYNELNDTLLFIYEYENNKIVYFILENITFLYEFKAQPKILQVLSNSLTTFNVFELITNKIEHELLQFESLLYYVNTKDRLKNYEKYIFDNETQNLTIFGSENDWVTFNFYFEGKKEIIPTDNSYGFYLKDCKVTIRTCQFKCGSCNETFDKCSSTVCKKNFAIKKDDENFECFSNDQNFPNYIYYNVTNLFEKCYKSCKFCDLPDSKSSSSSHHCLVCDDNYLRSYMYPGNCYQIHYPFNNSIYTKLSKDISDDNYTLVDSCPNERRNKIMNTGECVESCPITTPYFNYYLNASLNISLQEENFIGLLYPLDKDKEVPKYNYHKGCYTKCPIYTKANDQTNKCDCKFAWNYELDGDIICYEEEDFCKSPDYFYHDDTKECKLDNCNDFYYKFNFECYKEKCPIGTQSDNQNQYNCISIKPYCYINEEFKTKCRDTILSEYPLKFDDSKIYFNSCDYSNYYFKKTTYLYKKICYINCPLETYSNNDNGRCSCKYYIYYLDSSKSDYECLQETERCIDRNKYNISEVKECVDSREECINRGYKIFNKECIRVCPQNSEFSANNNCICKFKYYKENDFFTCFGEGESCENLGFPIKMSNTNECFKTKEECINKGYKVFNNICYETCLLNSEDKDGNGICLCKYNYINISNELTCFGEEDSCESKNYNYINLDTKECFSSLESCKNRDLKTFNNDCYSVCPRNTKENSTDTSSCICSYYFFKDEDNKLNCFEQNQRCETVSENYIYTNIETKECFESMQSCIITGSYRICMSNCNKINSLTSSCNQICDSRVDFVFNDICYKFYCPQGTKLNSSDPNNRNCICEEGSKIDQETGLISCIYAFPEIFNINKDNCPYIYNKNCVKKCPDNTCLNSNTEELNVCVDMRPTTRKYNGICIEGINEYIQQLAQSEDDDEIKPIVLPSGVALNAYPSVEDLEDLINEYPNLTYVNLADCKDKLKYAYKLPNETILYILGIDTPNLYGNSTINVFNFEIYLKNGTQLKDLSACNNSRIIITSAINDLEAAHFYKAIEFYNEGYDIYNKSNLFYQDYCAPAQDKGNDITLVDRAKYYYPSSDICNKGCIYNMIDFDSKRFICKCNADLTEKIYIYEENEPEEKELLKEEEDQSYLEYFLSLMNYRIFLCINLFFEFKSFYYNAGFYISASVLLSSISLMIVFWIKGMNNVKIVLYKNLPTKEKLKEIIRKQKRRKIEFNEIENEKNIIIYKNVEKLYKENDYKDFATNDSKNYMNNKASLELNLKSNPPPKNDNIIKVNTFLENRKKQKEEEEEEEKENERDNKLIYERYKEDLNKTSENKKDYLNIVNELEKNESNSKNKKKEKSNKTEPKRSKKNKKNKKNKASILSNQIIKEKNSSKINQNLQRDNNSEDYGSSKETFDKENISNIKLKSPTMLVIPKMMESKNNFSLNSESIKTKEIEIIKKSKSKSKRNKRSKTFKKKYKILSEKVKDSYNNLIDKKYNTTNDDLTLAIDFNFLRLIDRTDDEVEKKDYNIIPYLQALRIDKRSNLEILISVFSNEIGFLNLFCYKNSYSHYALTISIYLFELLLDLTMNCFLYTDDVVSEKYHNDGNLSMLTSLSLSFISNIISSIAVFIIAKLTNYSEIVEEIVLNVKNKKKYFDNIIRLMKYIKIRLSIFYFLQLTFIIIMTYYLFIFCTVYHQSQVSVTINYIVGALTSLAVSIGQTVIISILRILSLNIHSNRLYNISRFIYDHF